MNFKYITYIARFIVAITYIFSGFVKLVDPIGSAIKFEEYFSEDVLNLTFLIPYSLPFSILLIMVELLLGVMLLVGFKPKFTTWAVALLMFVFLFLTWYSAYFDKVTDCGCFGDAVKLSAWATFYKNVFFMSLIIILLFNLQHIKPWFGKTVTNWFPFLTLLGGLFVSYYVLQHLPIIDFRPFAIGKNIPEGMEYSENDDFPPIHDFVLENEEDTDLTEEVLTANKALLIISHSIEEGEIDAYESFKELGDLALDKGYKRYMLSATPVEVYNEIQNYYDLPFTFLYCDETALKTMIRANPGIMTIENGTVTGKWNWTDIKQVILN